MEATARNRRTRFGAFKVDLRSGEVHKHGIRLKLQDQPFQVLALLLEHPCDVVTREEFRQKLWPADTFVDFDTGLNSAIKKLRDALGDSAEEPRYIETLPRRGYRFIARVENGDLPASATPESPVETVAGAVPRHRMKTWTQVAAALGIAVALLFGLRATVWRHQASAMASAPRIQSLAVLPLENLSKDPEQEYFADGMTEALITDLGKIGELRVISRTSVMHFKGTKKSLQEIAGELQVDALLEGTVARSGDRVRITANLVQASPEKHVWAESYARDMRDVLALQEEVARAIATEIKIKLSPQEQARGASTRPVDSEALEAYLKGRYEWSKWTPEGAKKSIEYFQRAVQKDPAYAQAWAGLADAYLFLARHGIWPAWPTLQEAKAATLEALELDETLSEGHVCLSMLMIDLEHSWPAAEAELQRAIALNPNNAMAHTVHGYQLGGRGRLDEAISEMKRARELDPLSPNSQNALGAAFYWAGRYDEALQQSREAPDPDANSWPRHWRMAAIYERKRMQKEAIAELLTALRLTGKKELALSVERKYLSSGYAEAKKTFLLGDIKELQNRTKNGRLPASSVVIAADYALLGEKDRAFEWLDKAFREGEAALFLVRVDDRFEALRSDPRFQDLLRRLGVPS